MKLESIDLNLLVSLRALIEERSVTQAAKRVGVGQSSMSGALSRLRDLVGDELLVRTPQGMVLTARAEEMREPLAEILTKIESTLSGATKFDPKTAERTFRIGTTDYIEHVVMPEVVRTIASSAPSVAVVARSVTPRRASSELEEGTIDLAIGTFKDETAGLYRHVLFHERLVCVVRKDHPSVGDRLDKAELAALPHILISPRGREKGPIDRLLEADGLSRHVVYVTSHFLVAPAIIAKTDAVVTLTEKLARSLVDNLTYPLRILELPFDVPPMPVVQIWHERTHADPAYAWFRQIVASAIA